MRVVHAGRTWPHSGVDPSTRQAMCYLEKAESLITWVQPKNGRLEDQIPVIHLFDDVYYVLSLRSMKVVFRHVRLHRNFINKERTIYGDWKLRIPVCLLREKIRTQLRFNVMFFFFFILLLYYCYNLRGRCSDKTLWHHQGKSDHLVTKQALGLSSAFMIL